MKRREFLAGIAAAPLVRSVRLEPDRNAVHASPLASQAAPAARARAPIRQSVMASVWGTGSALSFEERCKILAKIGFKGVDLPTAQQVPILKQYGLTPAMMTGTGTSFQEGLIRKELHGKFEDAFRAGIDMCAEVGCPNLIALPGERRGMPYEQAADNAVAILSRVKGYAEQKGVTLCMEITNAKVAADQRTDQVFNRLAWGLDVCRRVSSPRMKIVYDIYHAQISDGDVTRNLRDHFDLICHIHVAGVPSRQEIDDTQELNHRFIANAIADLGYTGFVAHEWRPGPGRDPIKSLEQCFEIMNV
ncbi:MAG TPA: TIM barrel protein [Vicinamibacterales bacterium]|nr:TIM barrel protein [Vicinamibacterales bacterium]